MTLASQKSFSIMKRSLTPNRPYHVQWFLTRKCNYRCRGCQVWRKNEKIEELSTHKIKKGMDILRNLGVIEIVFTGGNPLLRDDIDEILKYASKYFITTIYDNGSLAVEKMDVLRNVDFVAISLDTLNEELNDYMKGVPGSWKKAMNAIDTLHKDRIPVVVSPTISQMNLHEILEFTKHFTDQGIPLWYCLYGYDFSSENSLFKIGKRQDDLRIRDKKAVVSLCNALTKMKRERSGILITDKTLNAIRGLFETGRRIWQCKALQGFLMIDHHGRVAGCHCLNPVTSIFELPKTWDSPEFDLLREKYQKCDKCAFLCYIFYSLHGSIRGNIEVVRDQWKNSRVVLPILDN